MAVFVIADLHLTSSLNKTMDSFGRRWINHTEKLEKRWRAVVGEDDTVIIPGDISWGLKPEEALPDLRFIDSLPGKRKLLIKGNHDYWWTSLAKMNAMLESCGLYTIGFIHNDAVLAEGIIAAGSRGWFIEERLQTKSAFSCDYDKLVRRECLRIGLSLDAADALQKENPDARKILFLHFPPVFESFICRPIIDVLHERGIKECFFGHIHGQYAAAGSFEYEGIALRLISSDYLDFVPRAL